MSADLQGLIDRIRKEGLDKAESQAGDILAAAKQKADEMIRQAEKESAELREKAKADAAAFEQQGKWTLEKSARDLILLVQQAVQRTLDSLVRRKINEAMTPDLARDLASKVVAAYLRQGDDTKGMDLLVSQEDKARMTDFFMEAFREAVQAGLGIRAERGMTGGFKVSLDGDSVRHDFTPEAIAYTMAGLVRPRLAEILKSAIEPGGGQA